MANEQTSVPLYASSEILTAANMNISAGTGVPVFATTVTRDAAFGGASEKVLAEGQLCYLSSTNVVQYYDGAAWATVGPAAAAASGLTFISATTIGTTVGSVTVSSAFSATYENYRIVLSGGAGSANQLVGMTLGANIANYYLYATGGAFNADTAIIERSNNYTSFNAVAQGSSSNLNSIIDINTPFLAKTTTINGSCVRSTTTGGQIGYMTFGGFINDTTSYTAFTFTPSTGTFTGGTIRVYGYQNS